MKFKKGDTILVLSGKDKGKKGKIIRFLPKKEKVLVEGVNLFKRHRRAKRAGQKGQVIEKSMPMHVSKVALICSKCSQRTRVGFQILENKEKIRVCKKCGGQI